MCSSGFPATPANSGDVGAGYFGTTGTPSLTRSRDGKTSSYGGGSSAVGSGTPVNTASASAGMALLNEIRGSAGVGGNSESGIKRSGGPEMHPLVTPSMAATMLGVQSVPPGFAQLSQSSIPLSATSAGILSSLAQSIGTASASSSVPRQWLPTVSLCPRLPPSPGFVAPFFFACSRTGLPRASIKPL